MPTDPIRNKLNIFAQNVQREKERLRELKLRHIEFQKKLLVFSKEVENAVKSMQWLKDPTIFGSHGDAPAPKRKFKYRMSADNGTDEFESCAKRPRMDVPLLTINEEPEPDDNIGEQNDATTGGVFDQIMSAYLAKR